MRRLVSIKPQHTVVGLLFCYFLFGQECAKLSNFKFLPEKWDIMASKELFAWWLAMAVFAICKAFSITLV